MDVSYPLKLAAAMYGEVRAAADKADMSAAQWIRRAIREKLDRDA